jgi:hypothetical protein
LIALVFFGDMVAFFAGLAAGFFAAAGFLAFGFRRFLLSGRSPFKGYPNSSKRI